MRLRSCVCMEVGTLTNTRIQIMYGVLYAVSPELFPTKSRGTGNAIVASANRVFGIMVRVGSLTSSAPLLRGMSSS